MTPTRILTLRSLAATSLAAALALTQLQGCASGPGPMARATAPAGFEVHGHRGARARLPENTLPAFEHALAVGVDVLELDLAVSKDGVLVVSHDPHINPKICLSPGGKPVPPDSAGDGPLIRSMTLKQIQAYDCGTLRNERFPLQKPVPGARIPTLDEVFRLVRTSKAPAAARVRFNIETKIFPDHPEYTVSVSEFSRRVVEAFRASGFLSRILLQSFDPRTLLESRRREPKLSTALLVDQDFKDDTVIAAKAAGAGVLSPNGAMLNRLLMQKARDAQLRVVPWTLNTPQEWQDAIDFQVDGIITDDPEALLRFVGRLF